MIPNLIQEKQHCVQQKPAASSAAAKGTSLPAVSVLQPVSKNNVVQRYSVEDFGKLSEGRQMLWRSNYELFATGSKISEANGIGGDVGFREGKADAHIGSLKEVIAFIKEGSKLEQDMKGYDKGKEYKNVKPNAIKNLLNVNSLKNKYEAIIEDHVEDGEKLPDEVSSRVAGRDLNLEKNSKALVKELVEVALGELKVHELPGLEQRVDEYLKKQLALRDKPLMPSDCKAMASYVAGFVAGIGDEDVTHLPVEAGDVYEYNAPDPQKAEWPFHYATVIMTDGGDHVTMENAAAKGSDKFSKM
jgi:hypothetical protein